MPIWKTLSTKPWEAGHGTLAGHEVYYSPADSRKLGLRIFLAVITSLFALFISAYFIRMEYADWRPMPDPSLLWINTGFLMLSSFAYQRARNACKKQALESIKKNLYIAGFFTILFIVGQLWAWQQLIGLGYFAASNPANGFFYLITGMHGLHMLGGLWAWQKSAIRAWGTDGAENIGALTLSVQLCSVYWHFLLIIWIILFGLLLST